ncbi:DNA-binding protein [Paenibacillus sp. LMG 31456]|uniref:DNA-binding protein n=1 Tax=Paenibacillus foliorum TaxID=2654974 RepID=A0A972GS27_9BACL|nr:helix-turn-helix domain-containing protein [Paenibacillus foliorum]NOU95323.1 DNA-binding protein [Paenibacillus foliorum]
MANFEDWNQKLKKTFENTSNKEVLTVTEAGTLFNLSKDKMKEYVVEKGLTKVKVMRSAHRYLLLKSEVEALLETER